MTGHLKEGNERAVHITLSHDDVCRLKAAVKCYADWNGTDYGKVTRVYMVLDAAIGAAGYYPEEQPYLRGMTWDQKMGSANRILARCREELARFVCGHAEMGRDECPVATPAARPHWCEPCKARKYLEEHKQEVTQ